MSPQLLLFFFFPPSTASESPVESEVGEQKTAEEASRRRSLLAALERIGRTEEEEEKEEELQPPQRDEGSGFTVNKCILGAVILVGIGTVFFSGTHHPELIETFKLNILFSLKKIFLRILFSSFCLVILNLDNVERCVRVDGLSLDRISQNEFQSCSSCYRTLLSCK